MAIKRTWWSVSSDIDELKVLAEKLVKEDGGQKARVLSGKMLAAVPRFEATEEVCPDQFIPQTASLTQSLETKAPRIQTDPQATVQTPRAKLFLVRRSNPWQADEVHIFG
jgi:hypothetical protein